MASRKIRKPRKKAQGTAAREPAGNESGVTRPGVHETVAESSASAPTAAPTGCELGATRPGVNPHGGALQGTLTPHPKGSNGGTHRGPDNFPRKNVLRAIVMMSLAAMGYRPEDLPKTLKELQARRRKTHGNLFPAAMAHLMVRANMNIVEEAAMGDREAYGRFLQLQRDFHQIMAGNDGNGHGRNGHGGGEPFASRFVSQSQVKAAEPAPRAAEPPPGPDVVIDGQEYVGLDG